MRTTTTRRPLRLLRLTAAATLCVLAATGLPAAAQPSGNGGFPASSELSALVGNVDYAANTFDLISSPRPNTVVVDRADIDYTRVAGVSFDSISPDAGEPAEGLVERHLSEGDVVTILTDGNGAIAELRFTNDMLHFPAFPGDIRDRGSSRPLEVELADNFGDDPRNNQDAVTPIGGIEQPRSVFRINGVATNRVDFLNFITDRRNHNRDPDVDGGALYVAAFGRHSNLDILAVWTYPIDVNSLNVAPVYDESPPPQLRDPSARDYVLPGLPSREAQNDRAFDAILPADRVYNTPTWPLPPTDGGRQQGTASLYGDVSTIGNTVLQCSSNPAHYGRRFLGTGVVDPAERAQLCTNYRDTPSNSLRPMEGPHPFDATAGNNVRPGRDSGPNEAVDIDVSSMNDVYYMERVDVDGDPSTHSSSQATWTVPQLPDNLRTAGVRSDVRIVNAQLSWFGTVDPSAGSFPGREPFWHRHVPEHLARVCPGLPVGQHYDELRTADHHYGLLSDRLDEGLRVDSYAPPWDEFEGYNLWVASVTGRPAGSLPPATPFGYNPTTCPRYDEFDFGHPDATVLGPTNRPLPAPFLQQVQFRAGSGSYATVTDPTLVQVNGISYIGTADVTSVFTRHVGTELPPGTPVPVTVANVSALEGSAQAAGWAMTVVWEWVDPLARTPDTFRDIAVFHGLQTASCRFNPGGTCVNSAGNAIVPGVPETYGNEASGAGNTATVVLDDLQPSNDPDRSSHLTFAAINGNAVRDGDQIFFAPPGHSGDPGRVLGLTPSGSSITMRREGNVLVESVDPDVETGRTGMNPSRFGHRNGGLDLFTVHTDLPDRVFGTLSYQPRPGAPEAQRDLTVMSLQTTVPSEDMNMVVVAVSIPRRGPSINVEKSCTVPSAAAGERVTYTVRTTNDGETQLLSVELVDVVPSPLVVDPTTIRTMPDVPTSFDPATRTLSLDIGNLAIGEAVTVSYAADVPDDLTATTTVRNTATGTGTGDRLGPDGTFPSVTDTAFWDLALTPFVDQVDDFECVELPDSVRPDAGRDHITIPLR